MDRSSYKWIQKIHITNLLCFKSNLNHRRMLFSTLQLSSMFAILPYVQHKPAFHYSEQRVNSKDTHSSNGATGMTFQTLMVTAWWGLLPWLLGAGWVCLHHSAGPPPLRLGEISVLKCCFCLRPEVGLCQPASPPSPPLNDPLFSCCRPE